MSALQDKAFENLMKLSRRWEIATYVFGTLAVALAIVLTVVLIFTPDC